MSRKRASSFANEMEEYEYEYYRPGCYCTPQLLVPRNATPYTCAYFRDNFPTQHPTQHPIEGHWSTAANGVTYVVDSLGRVFYSSDYYNEIETPAIETEISYHFYDAHNIENNARNIVTDNVPSPVHYAAPSRYCGQCLIHQMPSFHHDGDDDFEEEAAVSPRKRERFEPEEESDNEDEACTQPAPSNNTAYRSRHGYLVEEPNEVEPTTPVLVVPTTTPVLAVEVNKDAPHNNAGTSGSRSRSKASRKQRRKQSH